uniref:Uncharacterized protein n=1 Tax=Arundo donax TaxID=35708 RepID=A0A0A9EMV8_ARUDO
MFKMLLYRV